MREDQREEADRRQCEQRWHKGVNIRLAVPPLEPEVAAVEQHLERVCNRPEVAEESGVVGAVGGDRGVGEGLAYEVEGAASEEVVEEEGESAQHEGQPAQRAYAEPACPVSQHGSTGFPEGAAPQDKRSYHDREDKPKEEELGAEADAHQEHTQVERAVARAKGPAPDPVGAGEKRAR